jgi:hypothetical protein
MGGLGNQLFQIFTTLAYCLRFQKNIVLPYTKILTIGINRNTYWESLLSNLKLYTTFNHTYGFKNEDLFLFQKYKELDHYYKEIQEIHNTNILFYGYFQSYKYFQDQFDKILSLIKMEKMKKEIIKEFPQYFSSESILISIHFRLGDYKFKQEYHPIISYEYYNNALSHILCLIDLKKPVSILYFCEEEDNYIIDPIIKNLEKLFYSFSFIKVNDNIEDWKQMLIMSNCHHNIIANSTFSWWGAYLNTNKDKIVYYPSQWFGTLANKNTDDMFPENWIKIV